MGADEKHAANYHGLSDDTVRGRYCDGTHAQTGHTTDGAEYDTWLAGVKAEAKREALEEVLHVLQSEIEDAPPANYEEDNYEAGYIAGLDFLLNAKAVDNQYKENQ